MTRRILTSLLVSFFAGLAAIAQNTSPIRNFSPTTDHIPGAERRNDLNGTPCALVKVQVVDDIERIEGNKIGAVVNKGVEKWVYMCKGSRNMKVHLKNHLPVAVAFRDYNILGLESNRVYELVLEFPDVQASTGNTIVDKKVLKQEPTNVSIPIKSNQNLNGNVQQPTIVGKKVSTNMSLNAMADTDANSVMKISTKEKMTPPVAFDGVFQYPFDGSIFKCRAKKGYVTIISIDTNATDIVIPSTVYYKGGYYPVQTLGSDIDGTHYSVERIIIQEGIEIIEKGSFSKFEAIKEVTIPSSIMEIGKKAFRNVRNTNFILPTHINQVKLKMGDAIHIR